MYVLLPTTTYRRLTLFQNFKPPPLPEPAPLAPVPPSYSMDMLDASMAQMYPTSNHTPTSMGMPSNMAASFMSAPNLSTSRSRGGGTEDRTFWPNTRYRAPRPFP